MNIIAILKKMFTIVDIWMIRMSSLTGLKMLDISFSINIASLTGLKGYLISRDIDQPCRGKMFIASVSSINSSSVRSEI